MRVLFVFNHPAPYKVSFFNEISKYLDIFVIFERRKAKDRPDAFYKNNEYNFEHMFLKHGAFGKEDSNTSELKKYIQKNHSSFDVIVMNGYRMITELRAIRWMNKAKVPYVLMINGGLIREKECRLLKNFKSKYISSAQYYLSSSSVANEYLTYYKANKDKIYIYPYSTVSIESIAQKPLSNEEKLSVRKKYNLPEGILYINPSQFIERKNNLQLIQLFKSRNEKLLLIGNGPLKNEYENFIIANNINNVYIMDFVEKEKALEIMSACDYHISLSKRDIYGHTIHEAMSRGLPVIASNKIVAAKTMIQDGYNGYITELDNEKITVKMDSINETMAINALNTAQNYTIEKSAEIVANYIKEIANK